MFLALVAAHGWTLGTVGTAGRFRFPKARLVGYLTDLTAPVNAVTPAEPEDVRLAGLLLGTRLASVSGGPIAYVATNPTTTNTTDATDAEGERA
ncbi:hypothetical protein [Kitasatospora sp. NPDC057500]|uniref:hypothetical protein n=1 Tax=Kitasatospora sp. NPDC057500 TaxID=3346151 RepID=UPI0036ACBF9D